MKIHHGLDIKDLYFQVLNNPQVLVIYVLSLCIFCIFWGVLVQLEYEKLESRLYRSGWSPTCDVCSNAQLPHHNLPDSIPARALSCVHIPHITTNIAFRVALMA